MLAIVAVLLRALAAVGAAIWALAAAPLSRLKYLFGLDSDDDDTDAAGTRRDAAIEALLAQVAPFAMLYANPELQRRPFTLCLDLDETLIHSTPVRLTSTTSSSSSLTLPGSTIRHHSVVVSGADRVPRAFTIATRPHLDFFLEQCSNHFELCVFTAAQQAYADAVLERIDPQGRIGRRFYRETCGRLATLASDASAPGLTVLTGNGSYTKDLHKVCGGGAAALQSAILLDDSPTAGLLQPDNLLSIAAWRDAPDDEELIDVLPLLMALRCTSDVRPLLAQRRAAAAASSTSSTTSLSSVSEAHVNVATPPSPAASAFAATFGAGFALASAPTQPRSRSSSDRLRIRQAAHLHAQASLHVPHPSHGALLTSSVRYAPLPTMPPPSAYSISPSPASASSSAVHGAPASPRFSSSSATSSAPVSGSPLRRSNSHGAPSHHTLHSAAFASSSSSSLASLAASASASASAAAPVTTPRRHAPPAVAAASTAYVVHPPPSPQLGAVTHASVEREFDAAAVAASAYSSPPLGSSVSASVSVGASAGASLSAFSLPSAFSSALPQRVASVLEAASPRISHALRYVGLIGPGSSSSSSTSSAVSSSSSSPTVSPRDRGIASPPHQYSPRTSAASASTSLSSTAVVVAKTAQLPHAPAGLSLPVRAAADWNSHMHAQQLQQQQQEPRLVQRRAPSSSSLAALP